MKQVERRQSARGLPASISSLANSKRRASSQASLASTFSLSLFLLLIILIRVSSLHPLLIARQSFIRPNQSEVTTETRGECQTAPLQQPRSSARQTLAAGLEVEAESSRPDRRRGDRVGAAAR